MSDGALRKSGSDWKSDSLLLTWNRGSMVPVNAELSLKFQSIKLFKAGLKFNQVFIFKDQSFSGVSQVISG